jgi:hypothetical protein
MKHSVTTILRSVNENYVQRVTTLEVKAYMDRASLLYLDVL